MYGFLQVMDPEAPSAGQTEPAKGPDSWVGDTLSGTVGIDDDTDQKKSDRFPSERGLTEPEFGENKRSPGSRCNPKTALLILATVLPPQPL